MNQKGSIPLIIVMLVVLIGLVIGVYFASHNTGFFSSADNTKVVTPNIVPSPSPKFVTQKNASPSAEYQNPFEMTPEYENPFDKSYENPFNNL